MSRSFLPLLALACVALLGLLASASNAPPMPGFRPPSVPLVVHDPYFSIWSPADNLYDAWPVLWDGTIKALSGMIYIDGHAYRFMGSDNGGSNLASDVLPQQGPAVVMPTNTYYTFAGQGIKLEVTFTSPIIPGNPELLSRPATYVTFSVAATDGQQHQVSIYYDNTAEITVNTVDEQVTWGRDQSDSGLVSMRMGTQQQAILGQSGDSIGIDWGYVYLVTPQDDTLQTSLNDYASVRSAFTAGQPLPSDGTSLPNPRACSDNWPVQALSWTLVNVGSTPVVKHLVLAYDDIASIQWFGTNLSPLWRNIYPSAGALLSQVEQDYEQLLQTTSSFDDEVVANLTRINSPEYAALGALAYRQLFGGLKPVWDSARNTRTYFLKEISSDGNLNTVDVLFPAIPGILYFDPTILRDLLYPVFAYGNNEVASHYNSPWAPHHVGEYPIGFSIGQEDMPIEETGNMILMTAAVYEITKDSSWFYPHYFPLLNDWADYLVQNLPYPGNQLCTDDFEGPSPNNSNLAVKGIVAISTFAKLLDEVASNSSGAQYYRSIANSYSETWQHEAQTDDGGLTHYRLQYNEESSWSLKYNIFPQTLLHLGEVAPFSPTILQQEIAFYKTVQQPYGLPLDDRYTFSKLDWEFWAIAAMGDQDLTDATIKAIYAWANSTPSRVPLTDWYDAIQGNQKGFQARPVVGGVFALALLDKYPGI